MHLLLGHWHVLAAADHATLSHDCDSDGGDDDDDDADDDGDGDVVVVVVLVLLQDRRRTMAKMRRHP